MIEKKSTVKSNFVGHLGIKNYLKVEKYLILPKVDRFFLFREIWEFKPIDENAAFSDLDFQVKNFDNFFTHFYEYVVNGVYKKEGEIKIPVTYCITLDKECCQKTCEKTGMLYDEILLYNQPVFYFIYVDIEEIFSFLRTNS